MPTTAQKRKDVQFAAVFLFPFLLVYSVFLLYPLAKGFWISLNDWHLLKVAFNPDAKEFVGLKNYIRVFWGREMEWGAFERPFLQGAGLLAAAAVLWLRRRGRLSAAGTLLAVAMALAWYYAFGWAPGEGGRWYNRQFWPAVGNTIGFVVLIVPASTAISLLVAVALNRETRAGLFLRTLFFLSSVLSVTVVTLIWKLMLSPNLGLITEFLAVFGVEQVPWLTTSGFATASVVWATIWWSGGIGMMLFLAALQGLPKEMYDAARIDGIGVARTFFSITLPNMRRIITLVLVLGIIAHFQIFAQVHLLTSGGPAEETQSLVRLIYQAGFRDNHLGRATAMATALLIVIAAFSFAQIKLTDQKQA